MSRYTLKTFYNTKQLERFDHRPALKLRSILSHPKHHCADQVGPWGEILENANRFEIFDSMMIKIFNGNIHEAETFIKTLR